MSTLLELSGVDDWLLSQALLCRFPWVLEERDSMFFSRKILGDFETFMVDGRKVGQVPIKSSQSRETGAL